MANTHLPVEDQPNPSPQQVLPPTLDSIFEQIIGQFGLYQFVQSILVSFLSVFDAQQTFMSVYTDFEPKWHCTNTTTCNKTSNICHIPRSSWAWDAPIEKSIISEWSLQCSSAFLKGLSSSSYFIGCLVGGFLLSAVGDSSLGRKNMLFLTFLVMSSFGLATAFSTDIWMYSAMRFAGGCGRAAITTCALVLLMERAGKRWRSRMGIMVFLCNSTGILSLPVIAYTNRAFSWRTLYLWTSIPAIVYALVAYHFVDESPRWLIMEGRQAEAKKILARLASRNPNLVDSELRKVTTIKQDTSSNNDNPNAFVSTKSLFSKSWALRRISCAMVVGFGLGMMYFGMILGVGNLGFDMYLSLTFNALMLIPSQVLVFFTIEKMKRKLSLLVFCLVSGGCSIVCVILKNSRKGILVGIELGAFFCVTMACNVLVIYAAELFPTCVRNSATSLVRQAMVFGSVFVPTLVTAGRGNEVWSFGVFGATVIFCGFFVVWLPETRGGEFCDTMDEQESKDTSVVEEV